MNHPAQLSFNFEPPVQYFDVDKEMAWYNTNDNPSYNTKHANKDRVKKHFNGIMPVVLPKYQKR